MQFSRALVLISICLYGCGENGLEACEGGCAEEACIDGKCVEADASLDMHFDVDSSLDGGTGFMDGDVGLVVDASGVVDSLLPDVSEGDIGPLPGPVIEERSLVWTKPAIVDDPRAVSLAMAMAAASDDGHGGRLFDWTLRRFGTTEYSIRGDQTVIADGLRESLGEDPSTWDLVEAPFFVTGVHLRSDLAGDEQCGQLRVSFSTTHATVQPFHLIFLFEMLPEQGREDCYSYAVRLARLSEMNEADFLVAARQLLDEHLRPDRFIMMESGEFTFFPWEWRQWARAPNLDPETQDILPYVFENPRLFQTIDVEGLNATGGARRREFLSWVADNAAAIDARTMLIPEEYRARFATAPTAIPRRPLSLSGLDPDVAARYPNLRKNLEIVGCPVCHTADAEFVQTHEDRTFSEFYEKELEARAAFLDVWIETRHKPAVPFGPLQDDPVLPD